MEQANITHEFRNAIETIESIWMLVMSSPTSRVNRHCILRLEKRQLGLRGSRQFDTEESRPEQSIRLLNIECRRRVAKRTP